MLQNTPKTDKNGMRTERRVLRAFAPYMRGEPWWFFGIELAPAVMDMRGVDFLALVKYPEYRALVKVPIQVKSTEAGAEDFYKKNPRAKEAGVIVLVVDWNEGFWKMRKKLFSELDRVRREGKRFDDFLERIGNDNPVRPGNKVRQHIEQMRIKGKLVDIQVEIAKHMPLEFLPPPMSRFEAWYHKTMRQLLLLKNKYTTARH